MRQFKTQTLAAFAAVTSAAGLIAAPAAAAPSFDTLRSANSFENSLATRYVETFESKRVGDPVTELDFRAGLDVPVTGVGNKHNKIHSITDGYGAFAHDGEKFWKVIRGSVTLDFSEHAFDAFGFWFSDLEWTTLLVTVRDAGGESDTVIDDRNPGQPLFWGIINDNPIQSVTLTWTTDHRDGIGFDGMTLGATAIQPAIPAPASLGLLAAASLWSARRRKVKAAAPRG